MYFRSPISSLLLLCASIPGVAGLATAQEPAAKSQNKLHISLLAVGDLPPVQFKDTDKGPVWIEPPVEDVPPPALYVKSKDKKEGFDMLNLGLNTPMPPIEYPAGKEMLLFEDQANAATSDKPETAKSCYLKVPLPDEKVDLTVILARDPGSKNWRKPPRAYTFKNDLVSFPADSVRVINLSSHPIKGRLASGEVFALNPSSGALSFKVIRAAAKDNVLTYEILGSVKGQVVPLANTATSFFQGTRLNMVIYDGDRKDSSGALRLCQFNEISEEAAAPAATGTGGQ